MGQEHPPGCLGRCLVCPALMAFFLGGCAGGAPSLVIFGAYFPAWLLSAMFGVAGALCARFVIALYRLETPYLLFVCLSAGIVAGCLFWLVLYGR